jgi:putative ABC transport system permease protein
LLKDFPEIEKAVRINHAEPVIGYSEQHFFASNFFYADAAFFEVFGYPLLKGDPHTVLTNTNAAVITESMAKKLFGNKEPIGQVITINDTVPLTISGVAKDLPANNHFNFDILASMQLLERQLGPRLMGGGWWFNSFYTYLLLNNPRDVTALNTKIANIMDKYNAQQNKEMGLKGTHFLQPLKDIHLHSDLAGELNPNGSIQSLRILGWIAGFLLLVACINYVNLTTATSFKRSKEIGLKKAVGASFSQLMTQFLTEAVLISFISIILAVVLAVALLPLFNKFAGTQISIAAQFSPQFITGLILFSILLGMAAGFFPSFYLSRIKPLITIRKTFLKPRTTFSLRKGLVVFQFSVMVALIIATIVAWQQLYYMQTKDLGFNKEQGINYTASQSNRKAGKRANKKRVYNCCRYYGCKCIAENTGQCVRQCYGKT